MGIEMILSSGQCSHEAMALGGGMAPKQGYKGGGLPHAGSSCLHPPAWHPPGESQADPSPRWRGHEVRRRPIKMRNETPAPAPPLT